MDKDTSTPLIDAARERQEEFQRQIAVLPPLRWYQWLRYKLWCWRHGL
jgi:hypothetical protein